MIHHSHAEPMIDREEISKNTVQERPKGPDAEWKELTTRTRPLLIQCIIHSDASPTINSDANPIINRDEIEKSIVQERPRGPDAEWKKLIP